MTAPVDGAPVVFERSRRLAGRLGTTPALHLADQVLSSGTNFLATVVVARNGTPEQFGTFSIFLITYYVTAGFLRWVPHSIAMTLEWDDERARNGYFFLPSFVVGTLAIVVLVPTFGVVDRSFMLLPVLLLPMLLQDAVRMHAFAVHRPQVALVSDTVWMLAQASGFLLVSTAAGAATVWGIGGLCGALVSRSWLRVRWQRRPIKASVVSSALEYVTLTGLAYVTPLLAGPIIAVRGVGALQGAGVIRGPITLLVQGLVVHRMAGPPVPPQTCIRDALRLSGTTLAATLACAPALILLKEFYGPRILGPTWPSVDPLVPPAILTLVVGSVSLGPATVVRKMGRFNLSAKVQTALAPFFIGLCLAGAAVAGPKGFLYGTTVAYALSATAWWAMLLRTARGSADSGPSGA